MTDINELQRFTGKGHEVILSYMGWGYSDDQWMINLKAEVEGVKLECKGKGDTPEAAFREAAAKFDRATFSGLPEMNPSLVYEGKAAPSPENDDPAPLDDEVPF